VSGFSSYKTSWKPHTTSFNDSYWLLLKLLMHSSFIIKYIIKYGCHLMIDEDLLLLAGSRRLVVTVNGVLKTAAGADASSS